MIFLFRNWERFCSTTTMLPQMVNELRLITEKLQIRNNKKKDQMSRTQWKCSTWWDEIQNQGVLSNQQVICFKPIRIRWRTKNSSHRRHTFYMSSPCYYRCLKREHNCSSLPQPLYPSNQLFLSSLASSRSDAQRYGSSHTALSSHHVLRSDNIRNLLKLSWPQCPSNTQW